MLVTMRDMAVACGNMPVTMPVTMRVALRVTLARTYGRTNEDTGTAWLTTPVARTRETARKFDMGINNAELVQRLETVRRTGSAEIGVSVYAGGAR